MTDSLIEKLGVLRAPHRVVGQQLVKLDDVIAIVRQHEAEQPKATVPFVPGCRITTHLKAGMPLSVIREPSKWIHPTPEYADTSGIEGVPTPSPANTSEIPAVDESQLRDDVSAVIRTLRTNDQDSLDVDVGYVIARLRPHLRTTESITTIDLTKSQPAKPIPYEPDGLIASSPVPVSVDRHWEKVRELAYQIAVLNAGSNKPLADWSEQIRIIATRKAAGVKYVC